MTGKIEGHTKYCGNKGNQQPIHLAQLFLNLLDHVNMAISPFLLKQLSTILILNPIKHSVRKPPYHKDIYIFTNILLLHL